MQLAGNGAKLSDTVGLNLDGTFSSTAAGDTTNVSDAGTYFAKLGGDVTEHDADDNEVKLKAGQIVRVPIKRDTQAPAIDGTIKVETADGTAVADQDLTDGKGNVLVPKVGMRLVVTLSDGANGGESVSGLADTATITFAEGKTLTADVKTEGGVPTATFEVSLDTLGQGAFDLTKATVSVSDKAANASELTLSEAEPLKGQGAKSLVVFDETEQQATASIYLNNNELGDGTTYLTKIDSGRLQLDVEKLLLGVVTIAWNPVSFSVDGTSFSYQASDFTSGDSRSHVLSDEELAPVAVEGKHTLTFTYGRNFLGIPVNKSVKRAVLTDSHAPTVAGASYGEADLAKDVSSMDDGSYLVGGTRDLTLNLRDFLAGDSSKGTDGAAGLDPSSVRVSVNRSDLPGSAAGEDPGIETEVENDGTVTVHLTHEGVYRLDGITLTFADKAGNKQENLTLSDAVKDMAAWKVGGTELAGIVVATSQPEVGIAVEQGEQGTWTSLDGANYFRGTVKVTLTVKDRWFDVWRKSGRADADTLLTGTLAPGRTATDAAPENLASVNLSKFENPSADHETWTYAYELPSSETGEGARPVEGRYQLKLAYAGFADERDHEEAFFADHSEPTFVSAALVEPVDASKDVATLGTDRYVIGGQRSIKVSLKDLLRGDAAKQSETNVAGMDWNSLKVRLTPEKDDNGSLGDEATLTPGNGIELNEDEGTATVALDKDGLYRLSSITFSYADRAGNQQPETSLADLITKRGLTSAWQFGGTDAITGILVSTKAPSVAITAVDHEGNEPSNLEGFHRGDVDVTLSVSDPWFAFWRASGQATTDIFSGTLTPGAAAVDAPADTLATVNLQLFTDEDHDGTWQLSYDLPRDAKGGNAEGAYALKLSYQGFYVPTDDDAKPSEATSEFHIDHTAPSFTAAELPDVDAERDVAVMDDGTVYVVGSFRTLRIRMQDLLRGLAPAEATEGLRDQPETAGIAVDGDGITRDITVTATHYDGMNPLTSAKTQDTFGGDAGLKIDDAGWVEIPLAKEGLYPLSELSVTVRDAAGSEQTKTLDKIVRDLGEPTATTWQFGTDRLPQAIIVDDPATAPEVGADVADGVNPDGTPIAASEDPYYHRGDTIVTPWVKDPWFDAYRHVKVRAATFSTVTLRADNQAEADEALPVVDLENMNYNEFTGRWEQRYDLPLANPTDSKDNRPVQGDYTMSITYEGLAGSAEEPLVGPVVTAFGVDYTGPSFGHLELSQLEPMQWGWIFATSREDVTTQVSDNLSGVHDETAGVNPQGTLTSEDLPVGYENATADYKDRPVAGALSFGFDQDAQRLVFKGTIIHVKDAAGNESTVDMGTYVGGNSNIPASWGGEFEEDKPYIGVSIDTVTPTIQVSFDNNDVRNGKYYNAARVATVTISESNFDLLQANDENREIATIGRDGSTGGQLLAKDFSNPSGDGTTWQATYEFKDDADWSLDVAFTDPAYHVAEPYHTDFIVDTQKPAILVTWDNNSVANGMYYKAPRTASIQVMDRNFSPEFATVSTTAADASGAPAGAPGISGWGETKPRQQWDTSVYFGGELHYTMKVEVTDLAGNVADPYTEPEFVIDMTAPKVEINDVTDKTAYADTIAPSVSFSDINFNPVFATVKLTGGRKGDNTYSLRSSEQDTATTKDVRYEDFPHELDNDDVYVLDAEVTDLAGNESKQSVTFSVNRFGSNYVLLDNAGNVIGTYLNKPQDIRVAEINASGLDEAKTHAELTHDTEVSSLSSTNDFAIQSDDDSTGWNETTYTFPQRLFGDDGYYRINLTSMDNAGNLSQNTMDGKNEKRDGAALIDFAIDGTAPSGDLVGVVSNGVYLDPNKQVDADVRDNVAVDSATLSVDGQQVAQWGPDQFGTSDLAKALQGQGLPADDKTHTIELVVTDKAGNQSKTTAADVMVTSDLVTYVLHTPRLLFIAVATIIAALLVIGVSIFLAVRHRRLTEARRNPFGYGK